MSRLLVKGQSIEELGPGIQPLLSCRRASTPRASRQLPLSCIAATQLCQPGLDTIPLHPSQPSYCHSGSQHAAHLHLLHQRRGLGAAQQALDVAQAGAKADAADAHATAVALRALGELVRVLGPLPAAERQGDKGAGSRVTVRCAANRRAGRWTADGAMVRC